MSETVDGQKVELGVGPPSYGYDLKPVNLDPVLPDDLKRGLQEWFVQACEVYAQTGDLMNGAIAGKVSVSSLVRYGEKGSKLHRALFSKAASLARVINETQIMANLARMALDPGSLGVRAARLYAQIEGKIKPAETHVTVNISAEQAVAALPQFVQSRRITGNPEDKGDKQLTAQAPIPAHAALPMLRPPTPPHTSSGQATPSINPPHVTNG